MEDKIRSSIQKSIEVKQALLSDDKLIQDLARAAQAVVAMVQTDGTFLAAGNGGSASDAQHIVAEFVGRFYYDRPPLRAIALSTNTSNLTCIGNDYGYEHLFSRQVLAIGRKGDVFLAISTSGNSPNIVSAAQAAKDKGITVIGLTGANGGRILEFCDIALRVPSTDTARIQESHILLGHILCELVEADLFPKEQYAKGTKDSM